MINYDVKFITCNETFAIKNSDDKIYKCVYFSIVNFTNAHNTPGLLI